MDVNDRWKPTGPSYRRLTRRLWRSDRMLPALQQRLILPDDPLPLRLEALLGLALPGRRARRPLAQARQADLEPLANGEDVWPVGARRSEERVRHAEDRPERRLVRVDKEREGGVVDVEIRPEVSTRRKLQIVVGSPWSSASEAGLEQWGQRDAPAARSREATK